MADAGLTKNTTPGHEEVAAAASVNAPPPPSEVPLPKFPSLLSHIDTVPEDIDTAKRDDGGEGMASLTRNAKIAQGYLCLEWRHVAKPRKRPSPLPAPDDCLKCFEALLDEWLRVRCLDHLLTLEDKFEADGGHCDQWRRYRYLPQHTRSRRAPLPDAELAKAYHGTWMYALRNIIISGILLESDDKNRGHEFWCKGVYCSPLISTAYRYARPQVLFNDGPRIYTRVVLELSCEKERLIKTRSKGGEQRVYPSAAVYVSAVLIQVNAPPARGEERVDCWQDALEA